MKHWLSMLDYEPSVVLDLLGKAKLHKAGTPPSRIQGRLLALLFMNPSLRTRLSFEALMKRFGGDALTLSPGSDTWKLEFADEIAMDGDKPEHIKEAAPVIGRYVDAIGIRTFADLKSIEEDATEGTLNAFREHTIAPLINLESATEHPCQGLADMLSIREKLGEVQGKQFVLSWAPHVKALPMAVPHSALIAAAYLGMNITLARPKGYDLMPELVEQVQQLTEKVGTSFSITEEQTDACSQADVVYVKSWGSAELYGEPEKQSTHFRANDNWCVGTQHLENAQILMHCLPVRRNVVITDAALDSEKSVVIDQAENRLWAQTAIVDWIFSS